MTSHLWVLIFWTPCSLFLVFWSYLLYLYRICWEGNSWRKWGEFGMGGFDEIVISSLWYEKNICSCQKNVAIIKINTSVHADWWFVLSDSIIYYYLVHNYFFLQLMTMKLWKRKMQLWYDRGTITKWLFYIEWCYLLNL